MDAITGLMLLEALLIIAAIVAYKAIRSPSHSPHDFHSVPVDNSNDDAVPISMDSSSSFDITVAHPSGTKYEVFLSFRGEDTRDNFTSHLYEALCKAKIQTFIDNRLEKGEGISPVLLRTIEESAISVIIFSKDYASSTWCLDELVKILECKQKYGRVVIPVFYNIDPSNIRKQSGSYGAAFIKHGQRFKNKKHKVQRWRDALTQAASLSGWDSKNIKPESKLIKEIVKDILSKLNHMSSCHFEGLVGIHHHIEKIEELLSEVRILGIWGMGGIGKTTLAKVIFQKLKAQFESFSFVENIREQLAGTGLEQVQKKCLSELLEDKDIDTYDVRSSFVKNRLQCKKILLVLDDVDSSIQAGDLIKLCDWFGQGSRIIITSRDRQVLKNASPYDGAYETYHVQEMNFHDALHLFSLRAFKLKEPTKSYVKLSDWVVHYCQGNPLALIVLGCFLYGRGQEEWESALEKLKQAPHKDIFNVLKLSFDGLDDKQKNIFLDLACFFRGPDKFRVDHIGDCYDSSAYIEISVLKDGSLVSVNEFGYIKMHDLVKEMGQEIARQQYINDPRNPIRLWKHEDIYHFLRNNTATETIQGISLDMSKTKKIYLKADAFEKMYNLRILRFFKSDPSEPSKVYFSQGLDILPEELRILQWVDYPLPYVPLSFCAESLVYLQMHNSHLQELWDENQHFPNLKIIDLRGSELLTELPDLSHASNITEIMLAGYVNLLQINSSKCLVKLRSLTLGGCNKLRNAGILTVCSQLRFLEWTQCPLQSLPLTYCLSNLVILSMPDSQLEQLWDGQQHFPHLEYIDLTGSKHLIRMPDLSQAPNIKRINLSDCTSLLGLYSSSFLSNLEILNMEGCNKLMRMNFCWDQSPLQSWPVNFCTQERSILPHLFLVGFKVEKIWSGNQHIPKLSWIKLNGRKHLIELPYPSQTPNFRTIYSCENLVQTHSSSILLLLQEVYFDGCNKLRHVNLTCNVHPRSLGTLVIACNYFDLKKLTFSKAIIRLSISDDGNIYGFGFKAISVAFTKTRDCMDVIELGQSLSSLLPFVHKLRCFNITSSSFEFESFSNIYMLGLRHSNHLVPFPEKEVTTLELWNKGQMFEVKTSSRKGCVKGIRKREREAGMGLVPENSTQLDCDCTSDLISKVPNTITRWLLLTDLSLQGNDFVSVHGGMPGLSSLKSLAESDCSRLQPIIDLTFPLNAKPMKFDIRFSQEFNQSDSNHVYISPDGFWSCIEIVKDSRMRLYAWDCDSDSDSDSDDDSNDDDDNDHDDNGGTDEGF